MKGQNLQLSRNKPDEILVALKKRDEVLCYLTLPPGSKGKNLPMILYVHGGPWARDEWGFNGVIQFLANRGYAVLQVNYGGSTGYGRSFLNGGIREFGVGAMQNDLTDAVMAIIAKGIANPKQIAIMGASYGGYATLAGLTFMPNLYACGVSMCGVSIRSQII